jgi:hypothetical protein
MFKRDRSSELVSIITILFMIGLILYNLSSNGFLKLTTKQWEFVWAICENGIPISLCLSLFLPLANRILRIISVCVFIQYFLARFIYHFSCHLGKYIISKEAWEWIWSIELAIIGVVGLIIFAILVVNIIRSWQKK